jgi:hypothetical protein
MGWTHNSDRTSKSSSKTAKNIICDFFFTWKEMYRLYNYYYIFSWPKKLLGTRVVSFSCSWSYEPCMYEPCLALCRICVVCAVAGEEVLPASVLAVRLDPRRATHCGHPVLPHHTEPVPRYRDPLCLTLLSL